QKLIRAPFAGELGVRKVDIGQIVAPGTNMVSLTNLSQVLINFTLPEQERGRLQIGQEVSVTSAASAGQKFTGTLTAIEPQVDPVSRQISLQATLSNRDHRLYPGMYVDVTLGLSKTASVLTVPETAIDFSLYGESVYRITEVPAELGAAILDPKSPTAKPYTKVERIPVKTGEHFNGRVEILSGLNPGDRVVAEGQNRLHDQAKVTVSTEASPLVTPAVQARP
ncbi:MAG: efflux RND transporter periplasmic adaptor subunit, partial [Alphaproteobacteria bacterium]|nr:efflux RND transporter periplasmic adaptor subunit [Alphaproteobacteria bacterium]